MEPVNALNIDVNNKECFICKELLSSAETFKLPSCNCEFHTHCIVTWFRSNPSTQQTNLDKSGRFGGQCPYCGDCDEKNTIINQSSRIRGYYFREGNLYNEKKTLLTNYQKKHPDFCTDHFSKVLKRNETAKKHVDNAENDLKKYKEDIKNNSCNFYEADKKIKLLRKTLRLKRRAYRKTCFDVAKYPILPIIVPSFVDIN